MTRCWGWLMLAFLGACHAKPAPPAEKPPAEVDPTQAALRTLEQRPSWLFPFDQCPADAFPGKKVPLQHAADACMADLRACLADCRSGDEAGCFEAALRLQGIKAPPDYSEALFLRSCRLGVASGCTNRAAGIIADVADDDERWACANRTFEAMCGQRDPWGCTMWGASLAYGRHVERNVARALAVLPGGCTLGDDDPACESARDVMEKLRPSRKRSRLTRASLTIPPSRPPRP